jgi:DNA-binding transcriptional regulator YhcF (GntR family)
MDLVQDSNAWNVLIRSLAKRASFDQYQKSFPSLKTIQKDTNLSKPTVLKALAYLEQIGVIKVKRGKKDGVNQVNVYSITTPLIKTIGDLKMEGVVKEIDHPNESISKQTRGLT